MPTRLRLTSFLLQRGIFIDTPRVFSACVRRALDVRSIEPPCRVRVAERSSIERSNVESSRRVCPNLREIVFLRCERKDSLLSRFSARREERGARKNGTDYRRRKKIGSDYHQTRHSKKLATLRAAISSIRKAPQALSAGQSRDPRVGGLSSRFSSVVPNINFSASDATAARVPRYLQRKFQRNLSNASGILARSSTNPPPSRKIPVVFFFRSKEVTATAPARTEKRHLDLSFVTVPRIRSRIR